MPLGLLQSHTLNAPGSAAICASLTIATTTNTTSFPTADQIPCNPALPPLSPVPTLNAPGSAAICALMTHHVEQQLSTNIRYKANTSRPLTLKPKHPLPATHLECAWLSCHMCLDDSHQHLHQLVRGRQQVLLCTQQERSSKSHSRRHSSRKTTVATGVQKPTHCACT